VKPEIDWTDEKIWPQLLVWSPDEQDRDKPKRGMHG
jgi:hypothetical protein